MRSPACVALPMLRPKFQTFGSISQIPLSLYKSQPQVCGWVIGPQYYLAQVQAPAHACTPYIHYY